MERERDGGQCARSRVCAIGAKHGTAEVPAFSIFVCSACSLLLCTLRFKVLMLFDVFFSATLLLFQVRGVAAAACALCSHVCARATTMTRPQFAAFGWMRHTQPQRPRPFAVGCGWLGVAFCLVLPVVILLAAIATGGALVIAGGLLANFAFVLAYYARQLWRARRGRASADSQHAPLVATV